MTRKKAAFVSGTITNDPLASGGTTLNSAGLSSLPEIVAPDIAIIILDPAGSAGAPEVVWVTAHTTSATSATIARAKEGTSARAHLVSTVWVHGPTILDIEEEPIYAIERELEGNSVYRSIARLGPLKSDGSFANNDNPAPGWRCELTNSGYLSEGQDGKGELATDTTISSYATVRGQLVTAAADWTLMYQGILYNEADRSVFIGAKDSSSPADSNNSIGFRILTSGNIVGFVDSAGTETTRDTGTTPDGTSTVTLKVQVSEGGTIVRFFKDGAQVGADVTTNIPAGAYSILIGIINAASANKKLGLQSAAYWMEQ